MKRKRILIVDDDPRNIFALKATLIAAGYLCEACASATEAIAILGSDTAFDAVLIDMMMPDIDGYEAIPLIRNLDSMKAIPIIAVTAQAMKGDRQKCLNAGADDYISKPVDVDRLLHILASLK